MADIDTEDDDGSLVRQEPTSPDADLKESLRQDEEDLRREGTSWRALGGAMANELVKSYGLRRDSETGQWSWNLGNIAQAFKESPVWTSIDWATVMFSPAKFGLAAASIARGAESAGAIGKGYRALRTGVGTAEELQAARAALAGKSAKGILGRTFQAAGSLAGVGTEAGELAAATEMKLAGPSRLHGVQVPGTNSVWSVASPIDVQTPDSYLNLVDKFGAEVWENRAILKVQERERLVQEGMFARKAEDLARSIQGAKLDQAGNQRFMAMLEDSSLNSDAAVAAATAQHFANNPAAQEAFKNTWGFRNTIHQQAYDLGLISQETYADNLYKWSPRMYEEWEEARRALGVIKPRSGMRVPGKFVGAPPDQVVGAATRILGGEEASFAARSERDMSHLTQILDPSISVTRMAQAGQTIAREKFAQGIAQSVLAAKPSEALGDLIDVLATRDKKRMLLLGLTSDKLDAAMDLRKALTATNREQTGEQMLELLGWRKADDLAVNMPQALKDVYLDPRTSKDVLGVIKFMQDEPKWYATMYKNIVGTFRASKTAYVPGTHIRNILGGAIFSTMATGEMGAMVPVRGIKAFQEGGAALKEAAEAGVIGSSFDLEIHSHIAKNANLAARTALDWLPQNVVTDYVKKGAGAMERFYRTTDEYYKLDAWLRLKDKYEAIHGPGDLANSLATIDVNKYMPNFLQHSELTDMVRKGVPFASFTSESMRVWKNHLTDKPHMVFFANHMAKTMSEIFGAMAGFSPDQIDEATNALPSFMQNKKTLLLPFNVDGQPRFLDLSYVIPMGSLSDAETSERFFFNAIVDPTTNPIMNMGAAIATDKDPFTGRDIAPNFTERQLGIPVTGPRTRRLIGLGEHMMQTLLPPWAPPGYAGTNILEALRGQVNPNTGEKLEDGVFRTVAANILGFRTYAPDVESQIRNVQEEQRQIGEQVGQAWNRWNFARANGKVDAMEDEHQRIVALKTRAGDDDPEGYFAKGAKDRADTFGNISTKQLEEVLQRAEKLGALSPRDEKIRAELMARYQSRTASKSKGKKQSPPAAPPSR